LTAYKGYWAPTRLISPTSISLLDKKQTNKYFPAAGGRPPAAGTTGVGDQVKENGADDGSADIIAGASTLTEPKPRAAAVTLVSGDWWWWMRSAGSSGSVVERGRRWP